VVELAQREPSLRPVIGPGSGMIAAGVVFGFTAEHARTLTDAMMRRSMIGYDADAGFDAIDAAAEACARILGWTGDRTGAERTAYREYMTRFLPRALVDRSSKTDHVLAAFDR